MSTSIDLPNGGESTAELRGRKALAVEDHDVNGHATELETKEESEKEQGTWGRAPDGTGKRRPFNRTVYLL